MADITDPTVPHVIADGLPTTRSTSYMLHLPLYNGIVQGKIGAYSEDGTARIVPLPQGRTRPELAVREGAESEAEAVAVVWYGTSILQGAMAGRPGHQFTNVVSRELGVEIYNEGFSASGTTFQNNGVENSWCFLSLVCVPSLSWLIVVLHVNHRDSNTRNDGD